MVKFDNKKEEKRQGVRAGKSKRGKMHSGINLDACEKLKKTQDSLTKDNH